MQTVHSAVEQRPESGTTLSEKRYKVFLKPVVCLPYGGTLTTAAWYSHYRCAVLTLPQPGTHATAQWYSQYQGPWYGF